MNAFPAIKQPTPSHNARARAATPNALMDQFLLRQHQQQAQTPSPPSLRPPEANQCMLPTSSMAEFGAENQRPRPSSALLLLMAAQDIVLHLLWLLMSVLHRVTTDTHTKLCGSI